MPVLKPQSKKNRSLIKGTGFKYPFLSSAKEDIQVDVVGGGMKVREAWEKYRDLISTRPSYPGFKVEVCTRWGFAKMRKANLAKVQEHTAERIQKLALDRKLKAVDEHFDFMQNQIGRAKKVVIKRKVDEKSVDGFLATIGSIDKLTRTLYGLDNVAPLNNTQRNIAMVMNGDVILNQAPVHDVPAMPIDSQALPG